MPYRIEIIGSSAKVTAEPGETILAALLRQGVPFTYSCLSGNCGSCKCRLIGGAIAELPCSEHVLNATERERGVVLACRSEVMGPLHIQFLAPGCD